MCLPRLMGYWCTGTPLNFEPQTGRSKDEALSKKALAVTSGPGLETLKKPTLG